MTTPTFRSHIGCAFRDGNGDNVTSMQLIETATGQAIAVADFRNCELVRFATIDRCRAAAEQWRDGLVRAPLSEMFRDLPFDKRHPATH